MDKIEKYKNLNEEVKKMLKDARETTPAAIEEEIRNTANEICEALEDPNRVTALMRSGLLDSGKISRVRSALKDPEKAVKNPAIRMDLINMLMTLINIVTSNPSAYATVKKGAKAASEPVAVGEEVVKEEEKEKWIQGAIKRPGALRKKLGIEKGETIPAGELEDISSELSAEAEGEKTLSKSDLRTLRQVNLAKTLRGMK